MDVVFAVDSIPAIFAVTRDPFLVFTSNVFAILGLRSLYFVLAALMDRFEHLKYSLAAILGYVGVKMILDGFHIDIDVRISLGVIILALAAGVVASVLLRKHPAPADEGGPR
jgi:tellurite resistance protein TerC